MSARLGDGVHLYHNGVISFFNQPAADCGVRARMAVAEAARLMLQNDPVPASADEITNRTVMHTDGDGRQVIATDSIAFATDADRGRNVLVTAGHTGRSAVPYLRRASPWGFICSDGGRGMDDSGMAGLAIVEADGPGRRHGRRPPRPHGEVDSRTTTTASSRRATPRPPPVAWRSACPVPRQRACSWLAPMSSERVPGRVVTVSGARLRHNPALPGPDEF